MNKHLQRILEILRQDQLTTEQREDALKVLKEAEKEFEITEFKLNRTEKAKRTTEILFEETVAELEQKRKAIVIQNRELEVEAALERVRAQTMAMHNSEDVGKCVVKMFSELTALGVDKGTRFGIGILNHDNENNQLWTARKDGEEVKMHIGHIDMASHPLLKSARKAWKEQVPFHQYILEGQDLLDYYQMLNNAPDYKIQIPLEQLPEREIQHCFIFEHGFFYAFSPKEFQPELIHITKRFSSLFEQTYRRYQDLVRAEAQAIEAQIEAALERVRSRTMAMQKSNELPEVAFELFEQMHHLGFARWGASISLADETRGGFNVWYTTPEKRIFSESIFLPNQGHPLAEKIWNVYKQQIELSTTELRDEEKLDYDQWMFANTPHENMPESVKGGILSERYVMFSLSAMKYGFLESISLEPIPAKLNGILPRFAKVFEQTYTRFLDLQKAEAQAREAKIESALERVRSRSLAMHHSSELSAVVDTLLTEFTKLEFTLTFCIINLIDEQDMSNTVWAANPETGKDPESYYMKFEDYPFHHAMWDAWKAQKKRFVYTIEGKEKKIYDEYLYSETEFRRFPKHVQEANKALERYVAGFTFFKYSGLQTVSLNPISEDELEILERFGRVFEQSYTRFLDLQKAEAQAREAQIEAALERVRAKTMAMHKSEQLPETAQVLFEQFAELGKIPDRIAIGIIKEESQLIEWWATDQSGSKLALHFDASIHGPTIGQYFAAWKEGKDSIMVDLSGEALKEWVAYVRDVVKMPIDASKIKGRRVHHGAFFSQGLLLISAHEPMPTETMQLLVRFAKVFSQTYTRFLDLQKAEAQARDAQIEAGLERVRAKTMAMHNSADVGESVAALFDELVKLGVTTNRCGILIHSDSEFSEVWTAKSNPTEKATLVIGKLEINMHPMLVGERTSWSNKEPFYSYELTGQDMINYYQAINNSKYYPTQFSLKALPAKEIHSDFHFSEGSVFAFTNEPLPMEWAAIFKRFTSVFGQTYRRFLDLQKAEAQAREAQIEAALEKVRSRSLAMQSPDELIEVAQLLREEMGALGVEELETSSIYIHDASSGLTECWFTIKNTANPAKAVTDQMTIRLEETWVGRQMREFFHSPAEKTSIVMRGENRLEWIHYCEGKTNLFGTSNFYGDTIPDRTYHLYKFSNGYIGAAAPGEISQESWDLLRRATTVFSFAYTRFQDLQNAQASARTAMRQASLDRIRADISSMRNADDLDRITPLIFKELTVLGVPFIRCGVFIINEKQELVEAYLSSPDGNSLGVLRLPYSASELTIQTVEAWRKDVVYRQHWNKEDFIQWINQLMEQDQIQDSSTYQGTAAPPESLDLHFVPFKQGMLYVGAVNPLEENELELVQALAKAFSIAYARYEDFVKLESAKAEVESAMKELKATQSQLIQAEKMASLGELTAGIAHEIQNPLNFVNNFSEVSAELVDEMNEELEKGDLEEVKYIASELKENLSKINHHGKRAGSIVRGMLEHSRKSEGKKELTDLNQLADECLRLSFHGLRAKDKTFQADFKTDFDPNLPKLEVVSQDIGRVLLNLINNAFYAVNERVKSGTAKQDYLPIVTVSSTYSPLARGQGGSIEISVKDNGPGIPEAIKEKIFQPFFTTKPTGQGTGLGLSLSYDIVKAHGGELKVETVEGQFTRFTVHLPLLAS